MKSQSGDSSVSGKFYLDVSSGAVGQESLEAMLNDTTAP